MVIAGVVAVASLDVATTPRPAAAHGVGGVRPTNYETEIQSIRPRVRGVALRVVDLGDRLEVTNSTRRDVVVLGYDGEPYLRVGPRGAFENTRSPATYVNRTRRGNAPVPERADPEATPRWHRIGDEPVVRWHDHRAHWTSPRDAPAVRADPGREHLVQRFEIEMRHGEQPIVVRGALRWIPGGSILPWLALAFVIACVLVALSRTRAARLVVACALADVVVVETLHVIGAWDATTADTGARLGASVYALGALAVASVALVWVARRGLHAAAPLVLIAGLFVALAGGLADISVLTRSQVPTTLPVDMARALVAAALGLGIGLAVVAALQLRAEPARDRRSPQRGGEPEPWPETQSWHSSSSVT